MLPQQLPVRGTAPAPGNGPRPARFPGFRARRARMLAFFAVTGPGLVAANAGNDAGGIATYATVGAEQGYQLLWMMVLITFSLGVVQEMCARMGAATGKGLSDLIREQFGIRWVALAMLTLFVANTGTTVSEFAGIAASMELFGVSKYLSVPAAGLLVWLLVVKGSYQQVEKVFLVMTLVFFAYPISAILAHPNWSQVATGILRPSFSFDPTYVTLFIATVGTTITPYMQVFVQSSTVEKGVTPSEYPLERIEVYLGSLFSNGIALTIIIATAATLHAHGQHVESAAQAAVALTPFAGPYASALFAIGLLGASLLAAAVLPLATAYSITEAFGFEHGVSQAAGDAPVFMIIFTGLIVFGVVIILIPGIPLIQLLLLVQVLNGLLLPILLVFIIRLASNRDLMGSLVSGPVNHTIAILTASAVTVLSVLLILITVLGWFGVGPGG